MIVEEQGNCVGQGKGEAGKSKASETKVLKNGTKENKTCHGREGNRVQREIP